MHHVAIHGFSRDSAAFPVRGDSLVRREEHRFWIHQAWIRVLTARYCHSSLSILTFLEERWQASHRSMKDPKGLWGLSPGKSFTSWVTDPPLPQSRMLRSAGKLGVEAEGLGGSDCHPFTAPTGPRQPSLGLSLLKDLTLCWAISVMSPQGWRPFIQTVPGHRGGGRAGEKVLLSRLRRCGALAQRHQRFLSLDCGQEVISNLSLPSRKSRVVRKTDSKEHRVGGLGLHDYNILQSSRHLSLDPPKNLWGDSLELQG